MSYKRGAKTPATPKSLDRSSTLRSASSATPLTLDDVHGFILRFEEKIVSRLDSIVARMSNRPIELHLERVTSDQIQVRLELDEAKQVIIRQQTN